MARTSRGSAENAGAVSRVLTFKLVIVGLTLSGVLLAFGAMGTLHIVRCQASIADAEDGVLQATETCADGSIASLRVVTEGRMTELSTTIETNFRFGLRTATALTNVMEVLTSDTTTNKSGDWAIDNLGPTIWAEILPYQQSAVKGLLVAVGSRSYVAEWYNGNVLILDFLNDTHSFVGPSVTNDGRPYAPLSNLLAFGMSDIPSFYDSRDPLVWEPGAARWPNAQIILDFSGYTVMASRWDAATGDYVSWGVIVELANLEYLIKSVVDRTRTTTGYDMRLYTCIASSWYADKLRELNQSNWEDYDQTNILTGVSDGLSVRSYLGSHPGWSTPQLLPVLTKDVNATDSEIGSIAAQIHASGGYAMFVSDGPLRSVTIDANGTAETYMVTVRRINDGAGIDWWMTLAINQQDIVGDVLSARSALRAEILELRSDTITTRRQKQAETAYIIFGVCIVIALLATVAAYAIIAPLLKIQAQMEEFGLRMELDEEVHPSSYLWEVRRMQAGFGTMMANLSEYRAYVPSAILDHGPVVSAAAPSGDVTIVFTDIKSSTQLWQRSPTDMNAAMELHNDTIRLAFSKYSCYEVKTIGDSFMLAFQDALDAVYASLDMQVALADQHWPVSLELPDGLLVRIGIHCGDTLAEVNPLTGRSDYRGTVVNTASRVEGKAVPGTVCVTEAVAKRVRDHLESLGDTIEQDLGEVELKGLGNASRLFILCPKQLKHRVTGTPRHSPRPSIIPPPPDSPVSGKTGQSFTTRKNRVSQTSSPATVSRFAAGEQKRNAPISNAAVQQKTGLNLMQSCGVVAVVRVSDRRSKGNDLSEHCNAAVALVADVVGSTDGYLGSIVGSTVSLFWNTTKKHAAPLAASLRCATALNLRLPAESTVGVAMGNMQNGNIGTQKKRFQTTFGVPVEIAAAAADFADNLGAFCLVADCTGYNSVMNDTSVKPTVRMVDCWRERISGLSVPIYELSTTRFDERMANFDEFTAPNNSPARDPFLHSCSFIVKILQGDATALLKLVDFASAHLDDIVLRNVIRLHQQEETKAVEGARCVIECSALPQGARFSATSNGEYAF
ncbi:Adenylate cyclase [Diplonema papillatum]|nr:Adenylate cyclase [Diplonema papillatum]